MENIHDLFKINKYVIKNSLNYVNLTKEKKFNINIEQVKDSLFM
jgi:sulfur relay (sulfurtransferase) DsrF/TusC family protein